MESKLIPTVQTGNGYTYLKLQGILDEDNPLSSLLSQIQGKLLLVDMAEIERINSCGVRDWVNWLNQIQALGVNVILLRCSPSVVSQANMVTNFAADAFIHSFFAPYVHPDTGEEHNVLLFTEKLRQNKPVQAPRIRDNNRDELDFDEFEESYFAFIGDQRIMNYQLTDEIRSIICFYVPEAVSGLPVLASNLSKTPTGAPSPSSMPKPLGSSPGTSVPGRPAATPFPQPAAAPLPFSQKQPPYGTPAPFQVPTSTPAPFQPPSAPPYGAPQSGMGYTPQAVPPRQPSAASMPSAVASMPSAVALPQPSQPFRHNQPPIPDAGGYQSLAPQQPVFKPSMAEFPRQEPAVSALMNAANTQALSQPDSQPFPKSAPPSQPPSRPNPGMQNQPQPPSPVMPQQPQPSRPAMPPQQPQPSQSAMPPQQPQPSQSAMPPQQPMMSHAQNIDGQIPTNSSTPYVPMNMQTTDQGVLRFKSRDNKQQIILYVIITLVIVLLLALIVIITLKLKKGG